MAYYGLLLNIVIACYLMGVFVSTIITLGCLGTHRQLPTTNEYFRTAGWVGVVTFFCLTGIGVAS